MSTLSSCAPVFVPRFSQSQECWYTPPQQCQLDADTELDMCMTHVCLQAHFEEIETEHLIAIALQNATEEQIKVIKEKAWYEAMVMNLDNVVWGSQSE